MRVTVDRGVAHVVDRRERVDVEGVRNDGELVGGVDPRRLEREQTAGRHDLLVGRQLDRGAVGDGDVSGHVQRMLRPHERQVGPIAHLERVDWPCLRAVNAVMYVVAEIVPF